MSTWSNLTWSFEQYLNLGEWSNMAEKSEEDLLNLDGLLSVSNTLGSDLFYVNDASQSSPFAVSSKYVSNSAMVWYNNNASVSFSINWRVNLHVEVQSFLLLKYLILFRLTWKRICPQLKIYLHWKAFLMRYINVQVVLNN